MESLNSITDVRSPAHTPNVRRRPNLKALTSIRFFAALGVALVHMGGTLPQWGLFAPVMSVAANVAVSFFFFLSGYILTYSHVDEYEKGKGSAPRFWIARIARIYPIYFVTLLFTGYVYSPQFHNKIHIVAYASDFLLLQSWSIRLVNFFHVPAWSVSNEAFFYLVFPFVFMKLKPSTRSGALLSIAGFWALALALPLLTVKLYPAAAWQDSANVVGSRVVFTLRRVPIFALPQFLAGISLAWLYLNFRPDRRAAVWLAGAGTMLLFTVLFSANHIPYILIHNGLLVPAFAMIILGLSEESIFSRALSGTVLVLLGEASFGLYMIHFVFNEWVKRYGSIDTPASTIWKLAIVIPLAVVAHLLIEKPCRRWILKWWSERHPAQMTVV
jgi:peptidoglycan/LPS O-acetylase OafA/YrhL